MRASIRELLEEHRRAVLREAAKAAVYLAEKPRWATAEDVIRVLGLDVTPRVLATALQSHPDLYIVSKPSGRPARWGHRMYRHVLNPPPGASTPAAPMPLAR